MAYKIDKTGDIIINGWENGIADSIADMITSGNLVIAPAVSNTGNFFMLF